MSPAGGYSFRQQRLEAGPRHQQNCTDCHNIRRMPGQFVPSPKNRTPRRGGSRVSRTGRQESGPLRGSRQIAPRAMCKIPPRTSSAPSPIRNILLLIHRCHAQQNLDSSRRRPNRSGGRNIVVVRVLDREIRINLRAFFTKRIVSGSPPGPSAFIGD